MHFLNILRMASRHNYIFVRMGRETIVSQTNELENLSHNLFKIQWGNIFMRAYTSIYSVPFFIPAQRSYD